LNIQSSSSVSSEKAHWQSIKNGNEDALKYFYDLYSSALYNYGSKFSTDKDLIKECIQELFVNLWIRRSAIGDPQHVKNYLFKSFRLSVFKKTALLQKHQEYEEAELYPFQVSLNIEDEIISAEQNEALRTKLQQSLSGLTDRQREAIFLKFYENLSYEEIAEVMGISVKASYKIMARALGFLKDNLQKDEFIILYYIFCLKLLN